MTVAALNALLAARSEGEHVEFKEAKNNFHFEKLVAYCVALSFAEADAPKRVIYSAKLLCPNCHRKEHLPSSIRDQIH